MDGKTVIIPTEIHDALTSFCDKGGLKMRYVVSMAIMAYIGKQSKKA